MPMIKQFTYKGLTWVDLDSPTPDEVKEVIDAHKIDPVLAEDLLSPNPRAKVEIFDDYVYLVLNFPAVRHSHRKDGNSKGQEVDFVIGKKMVITSRYELVDPLHRFAKIFEANTVLEKTDFGQNGAMLFYHMMRSMYESLGNELETIEESLKQIEQEISSHTAKDMVHKIAEISRNLLDFKHSVSHHKDILAVFEKVAASVFGEEYQQYARALISDYQRFSEIIRNNTELLNEIRTVNDSLLITHQNETVKNFTVLAFMTFPLALLIDLLTFPSETNPFLHIKYSFSVTIGFTFLCIAIMYIVFKKKKWL